MSKIFSTKVVNYCDDKNYGFKYLSLVRKSDNKEVYTCSNFARDDDEDTIDFEKLSRTFNYYFNRVNSSIKQQMENPRLTEDQKNELKFLDVNDYFIEMKICMPIGYHSPVIWKNEASNMIKQM